jgi:hypothetical protein
LETYCGEKKINVVNQETTNAGLTFSLKVDKIPTMEEFLQIRAAEEKKAAEEKAEEEQVEEETKEQDENASEQPSEAGKPEDSEASL